MKHGLLLLKGKICAIQLAKSVKIKPLLESNKSKYHIIQNDFSLQPVKYGKEPESKN